MDAGGFVFDGTPMTLATLEAIARGTCPVRLSRDPAFVARIEAGAAFVQRLLDEDGVIYGVTTGLGDSCTVIVPAAQAGLLSEQLYRYHGCGLGPALHPETVRAVLATRLQSLCQGYSGVSYALLERLEALLAHNLLPVIPEEGSVGASGDLTPLSYVAAVLCGERDVWQAGGRRPAADALRSVGLAPYRLRAKEGLALMNGTAVMTAQAALALGRADYLTRLATRITALATLALAGNVHHFDAKLFALKPHRGQQEIARRLREDLPSDAPARNEHRLQDRYSIRCAPHVIGVIQDALPWLNELVTNELNSTNDNPIVDTAGGCVLHGGHFYGGHIAMAMDTLKNAVANLADLLDRQLALLVDARFSNGLAPNLSGANDKVSAVSHGLKAVQISVSAWTAEALKLTMPASAFSRSTECHNQDKVSMGSIAARDAARVLTLTTQVCAGLLLALRQALELRERDGALDTAAIGPAARAMYEAMRAEIAFVDRDRALEHELRALCAEIDARRWRLYE